MTEVNKTLYIPLYGKAYVSRKGLFLDDPKAEEIWSKEGFPLKGKAKSKWLAYYLGIRAAVFDAWLRNERKENRDSVVLHLGCGLDSRSLRVGTHGAIWYEVDFPAVIEERRRYYTESETVRMLGCDIRNGQWMTALPRAGSAIVVMEGVSMYLTDEERRLLFRGLCQTFGRLSLLMDSYTPLAARLSRARNPVKEVGVSEVYGLASPEGNEVEGLTFVKEHEMIPSYLSDALRGAERWLFKTLYAGSLSHKLYRLYEYRSSEG